MTLLPRIFLASRIALIAALALAPFGAAPARAVADDKKPGGDEKKPGKDKKPTDKEEERKKAEEEARRRKEAEEGNWDKRGAGDAPWPEPPDLGEMLEAARHKGAKPPVDCGEAEPKPGVGGYKKPPTDGEAAAASAAGGGFGDGVKLQVGAAGNGDKKDDGKDPHKDEKKDDKKEERKDEHRDEKKDERK